MQITNFKKWIIPVLLVLILEIGFTFILTGNFTLVYDRKWECQMLCVNFSSLS